MINARLYTDGLVRLDRDGTEPFAHIDPIDGEIMLQPHALDHFTDDELLQLMKIGRKPHMWYGEESIWKKPLSS